MYNDNPSRNQPKVDIAVLTIGGVTILEKQLGFMARGVVVDNLTNQWIFIREAFVWVPPYVTGRSTPITGAQKVTVLFQTPVGFTQPTTIAGQSAYIRFTENSQPSAPGVSVAPSVVRWDLNFAPAIGTLGAVTKVGVAGTIHTADIASWTIANNGATGSVNAAILSDVTLGNLFLERITLLAAAGNFQQLNMGPLAGVKGTIGNDMSIGIQAPPGVVIANAYYSANLIGYDQ